MKHTLSFIITFLVYCLTSFAQPFTQDTTFDVNTNFNFYRAGIIAHVIEVENKGIYIGGAFRVENSFSLERYIHRMKEDGSIDNSFATENIHGGGIYDMKYVDDTIYYLTHHRVHRLSAEGVFDWDFHEVTSSGSYSGLYNCFHVFEDQSILIGGVILCDDDYQLYNYHAQIGRLHPGGKLDTTFKHDANNHIMNIVKYDENRLLLEGYFTSYDSIESFGYGMCRIYNDGSLDTSFKSPFTYTQDSYGHKKPVHVQDDGKIIVCGYFFLSGDTSTYHIARLMPNGNLDSTFNYQGKIVVNDPYNDSPYVSSVCPTGDNRYLVGGHFNKYQTHKRGNITMIDFNGNIDTTYFTGAGADSLINAESYENPGIYTIIPAKDDKFYVSGIFSQYDGVDGAPIVRILGASHVQVDEIEKETVNNLIIYPNPITANAFNIDVPDLKEGQSITLKMYDCAGKLVFQSNNSYSKHKQINCPQLIQGVYIISIESKGKTYQSKAVIH